MDKEIKPGIFVDKKKNQRMGIGALVLAVLGVVTFHVFKAPSAQADEAPVAHEQQVHTNSTKLDDLPPGTAKFEVTKKDGTHECDVYVTEQLDADGWDKLVAKAQKFGCEVKAMFTKGDNDDPKQAGANLTTDAEPEPAS